MSNNEKSFVFWLLVYSIGIVLAGPSMVFFALSYMGKEAYLKKLLIIGPFLVWIYILTFLLLNTNYIFDQNFNHTLITPWGRMQPVGPAINVLSIYFSIIGITLMISLVRFYIHSKDNIQKKKTKVVLGGFFLLLIGAPILEGIIPALFNVPAFPSAPILQAILALSVEYATVKYGAKVFVSDSVAEVFLQLIPNPVIVLDTSNNIIQINDSAEEMFKRSKDKMINHPLPLR